MTSTAVTEYDAYDPEQDITFDVEYCYTTSFEYQIWAPDRRLLVDRREESPYRYHHWFAPSVKDALDSARDVVQQFAEDPGFWKWDGKAESLNQ